MVQPVSKNYHVMQDRVPAAVSIVAASAVASAILALAFSPAFVTATSAPLPAKISDETRALGPVFQPGVMLSGGSNATTTLLGGIGVYSQVSGFSLPVFAALSPGPSGPTVVNETSLVQSYFFEGGVYAIAWNGSSWLIGGQRSPGGADQGVLIALSGGTVTNLTGRVADHFAGGGVWSVGWNGTSWLIGGNSSKAATLVAWNNGSFTDLSSRVVGHGSQPWVQMLVWNGGEWMVGGHGVFGLWTSTGYVDLFPRSPFQNGGVYSAAWNGTSWLAGGDGSELVWVRGEAATAATMLPSGFDRLALMIVSADHGWFVAGKGQTAEDAFVPELAFWTGSATSSATDYSTALPSAFDTGDIQGGIPAPEFGTEAVLMVGVGSYNAASGHGTGAMALLEPSEQGS
ncbi:MAG: hypothetical protein WB788_08215 [Thermoplasmata archaeon]